MGSMAALHLGPLHPVEQALTLLLAFGPFVLLAVVIVVRRRHDARAGSATTQVNTGTTASSRSPRS